MGEEREIAGHRVTIVPDARPLAFCTGLLRPRVFVSSGALERLDEDELAAVIAHESHHAARRDPLRVLIARAIGDAYSLRALPRREEALGELAADAAAVRSGGAAPLAAALLAFGGDAAPGRVDRLVGEPPRDEVPRALVVVAGGVMAGCSSCSGSVWSCPGTRACACRWRPRRSGWLCAVTARVAAMGTGLARLAPSRRCSSRPAWPNPSCASRSRGDRDEFRRLPAKREIDHGVLARAAGDGGPGRGG